MKLTIEKADKICDDHQFLVGEIYKDTPILKVVVAPDDAKLFKIFIDNYYRTGGINLLKAHNYKVIVISDTGRRSNVAAANLLDVLVTLKLPFDYAKYDVG